MFSHTSLLYRWTSKQNSCSMSVSVSVSKMSLRSLVLLLLLVFFVSATVVSGELVVQAEVKGFFFFFLTP
ncbi:hypothetical protein M6B38_350765 [Iris pallida]|uniref:Transmembrane protein n=1 Tax=Iris pallida TaxID=29817 RepID=A0AAX6GSH0_IRIPA|nr:hypothetical protein M6B38_350765 [Iris pallida]